MINAHQVISTLLVYVPAVVIPGPNFVAVVHKAVASTRASALALVAGIVVVNLFWASCAIGGIGLIFTTFPWIASVVKLAGAGYMMWFGLKLIINAENQPAETENGIFHGSLRQSFTQGVITNIGNPKSMAFYAAIFSTSAPAHVSADTLIAMTGVVGITALLWYGSVALTLSHSRIASAYMRARRFIDKLCGGMIVLLGIRHAVN